MLSYNKFWNKVSTFLGLSLGASLFTTIPSLAIINFVKFHLIFFPYKLDAWFFNNVNNGLSFLPLTSILACIGKVTPKLTLHISAIWSSVPGSCLANWLQGNPSIVSPCSLYFWYISSNSSNWPLKPHFVAVLTNIILNTYYHLC